MECDQHTGHRIAEYRRAAHMTQLGLALRAAVSVSLLGKVERGQRRATAALVGAVAHALGVDPVCLAGPEEGGDRVRRREFLTVVSVTAATAGLGPSAAASPGTDPARLVADRLGAALLATTNSAAPSSVPALTRGHARAAAAFAASRYLALADTLPRLLAVAEATAATATGPRARPAYRVHARTLTLAARVLVKLAPNGLEWIAADRAVHAAHAAHDPLALAEAQRLLGIAARRTGHVGQALQLTLAAVDQLGAHPDYAAARVALRCTAAHTAATAGQADQAADLLDRAATDADHLAAADPGAHRAAVANLVSYRVSTAYTLGDTTAALTHAATLHPAAIPTVERRGRLLVDVALAHHRDDRPARAYRALLAAESAAPGEVHTRATSRRLITALLADTRRHGTMPGLSQLAARAAVR